MKSVLVFVCFVSLALAGCGDGEDDPNGNGANGGNGGNGANMGTGGTGNSGNMGGGAACASICGSECVDDVGLDGMELAECIEACEMDGLGFNECLSEAGALLDCVEQFPNCEPPGLSCSGEALAFARCFGVL